MTLQPFLGAGTGIGASVSRFLLEAALPEARARPPLAQAAGR